MKTAAFPKGFSSAASIYNPSEQVLESFRVDGDSLENARGRGCRSLFADGGGMHFKLRRIRVYEACN